MIIGIDGLSLINPQNGIGRYTYQMISRLVLCSDHKWIIFLANDSYKTDTYFANLNVEFRVSPSSNKFIRLIWYHFITPFIIRRDKCDCFWGTAHKLPFFLPNQVKKVLTIHDLVWKKHPKTMRLSSRLLESFFTPRALKLADHILVDSKTIKTELSEEFPCTRNKITTIYLAANNNNENMNGQTKNFILYVGTIEPRKNLPNLISAYLYLSKELQRKFTLKIVGRAGWGRKLKIPNDLNIEVLGDIDDDQLSVLYSQAYVVILPSLYEGFGLPIVESFSHGVPVIVSNTSSMPEIVDDAGILINPSNIESITFGLNEILSSHELREELSLKAKKRDKFFSWDKSAKKLIGIFRLINLEK